MTTENKQCPNCWEVYDETQPDNKLCECKNTGK